ncbi:hypothetical protein Trydic_g2117 [Trypoxylus dichotomus]
MTFYYNRNAKDMKQLEEGQSVTVRNMDTDQWEAAQVVRNCDTPRSYGVKTIGSIDEIHYLCENRRKNLLSSKPIYVDPIILRPDHIQPKH